MQGLLVHFSCLHYHSVTEFPQYCQLVRVVVNDAFVGGNLCSGMRRYIGYVCVP